MELRISDARQRCNDNYSASECSRVLQGQFTKKQNKVGSEKLWSDMTGPGVEPMTCCSDDDVFNNYANWSFGSNSRPLDYELIKFRNFNVTN